MPENVHPRTSNHPNSHVSQSQTRPVILRRQPNDPRTKSLAAQPPPGQQPDNSRQRTERLAHGHRLTAGGVRPALPRSPPPDHTNPSRRWSPRFPSRMAPLETSGSNAPIHAPVRKTQPAQREPPHAAPAGVWSSLHPRLITAHAHAIWRLFPSSMRSQGRRFSHLPPHAPKALTKGLSTMYHPRHDDSLNLAPGHDNIITAPTLIQEPTLIGRPGKPAVPGKLTPPSQLNALMD